MDWTTVFIVVAVLVVTFLLTKKRVFLTSLILLGGLACPAQTGSVTDEDRDAGVHWWGCLRLLSAPVSRGGDLLWKRHTRLQNKEKIMLQSQHAQAAELHINAAYAHAAAGCEHSTGDHLSSQDLARMAYERSQEAAHLSKAIAKETLEPITV
jgi:hypothetical protein